MSKPHKLKFYLLMLVLTFATVVGGGGTLAQEKVRYAHLHPFTSDSVWNTAMGSGAKFEEYNGVKNTTFRQRSAYINSNNGYGIAMNIAKESDPIRSVTFQGKTFKHRVPENATVVSGTDGNLNVVDGQFVYEYWVVKKNADGNYTARYGVKTDLLGSGVGGGIRAAQFSTNGGLIRKHELAERHIPHALVMALHESQLKKGWVFPAISEDGQNGGYTGTIPMGSLFAIPPNVDLNSLGLSPEGLALGKSMQDYGVYVGDKASQVTLYASNDVQRDMPAEFNRMVNDFQKILRSKLQFVTNSTKNSIGGGGERRQPRQGDVVVIGQEPIIPPAPVAPEPPIEEPIEPSPPIEEPVEPEPPVKEPEKPIVIPIEPEKPVKPIKSIKPPKKFIPKKPINPIYKPKDEHWGHKNEKYKNHLKFDKMDYRRIYENSKKLILHKKHKNKYVSPMR